MKTWDEKLNPDNWRWSWIFGILGVLLCINFFGPKGILHLMLLQQQNSRLHQQIQALNTEITSTQKEIDLFASSREYQEHVLRDRLGYLQSHEYRVEFINNNK